VCRACAEVLGTDAWCDGHQAEARAALAWAAALPAHWDVAVTLWWVATGEVRLDSLVDLRRDHRLAAPVRAALSPPDGPAG
jgi:hypothetical protein